MGYHGEENWKQTCVKCNGTGRKYRIHVKMRQSDGKVTVSGPYDEMFDIIPTLRSRRFKWDPYSKVWWIDEDLIDFRKLQRLEEIIRTQPERPT